jgi:thymidylate synthase (FAD)
MARCVIPAAEALLDQPLSVLDEGFVRLVDYMGGDARVVQAARVSYGEGTKTVREDAGLIDYLMRHDHTSPFEQVAIVVHLKLPLFIMAQLVRHRTAKLNSLSARYSKMADQFYTPSSAELRAQGSGNKQVGEGALPEDAGFNLACAIESHTTLAYERYEELLAEGLSREQARMVLPQNLYTECYWQADLHNLFHFLQLRLHPHAQAEIQVYAQALLVLAEAVAPLCTASFKRHRLHGRRFSADELAALRTWLTHGAPPALSERQAGELKAKLGL